VYVIGFWFILIPQEQSCPSKNPEQLLIVNAKLARIFNFKKSECDS